MGTFSFGCYCMITTKQQLLWNDGKKRIRTCVKCKRMICVNLTIARAIFALNIEYSLGLKFYF